MSLCLREKYIMISYFASCAKGNAFFPLVLLLVVFAISKKYALSAVDVSRVFPSRQSLLPKWQILHRGANSFFFFLISEVFRCALHPTNREVMRLEGRKPSVTVRIRLEKGEKLFRGLTDILRPLSWSISFPLSENCSRFS